MAKDLTDVMRETLTHAVRDATKNISLDGRRKASGNPLAGIGGVAAGAGLAALAPVVAKRAGAAAKRKIVSGATRAGGDAVTGAAKRPGDVLSGAASKVGENVTRTVVDNVKQKVDESGGVGGIAKEAGKSILPFGSNDGGGGGGGAPGAGKGRRMPVQQSMDVAVPIETCYNEWTQFEEWPNFMHRVTRVTQEDPCTVSFSAKIWAQTKEFTAKIETQRPEERIKWRVEQGISHTGVVTFHELAPRLTRVELTVDVDPGSLLEKAARGMRHIKRAMRADLHRFKAYIEMQEVETGAWRGVIEDGELVEDHDPSYDEEREYGEPLGQAGEEEPEEGAEEEEEPEEEPVAEEEPEPEPEPEPEERREPARAGRATSQGTRSRRAAPGRSGDRRAAPGAREGRRAAPAGRRS